MDSENKKTKKERSNAFKMIRLLLIVVVVAFAYILLSGTWNPFKSTEVSVESKKTYENYEKDAADMYKKLYGNDVNASDTPSIFKEDGELPFGFATEDFGIEGNKDGVQRELQSGTMDFYNKYGVDLWIDYMINEDYAIEYYKKTKAEYLGGIQKEFDFPGGQIAFGQTSKYEGAFITFRKGTVVYFCIASDNKEYEKAGGLMELLDIDFKFPKKSELFN